MFSGGGFPFYHFEHTVPAPPHPRPAADSLTVSPCTALAAFQVLSSFQLGASWLGLSGSILFGTQCSLDLAVCPLYQGGVVFSHPFSRHIFCPFSPSATPTTQLLECLTSSPRSLWLPALELVLLVLLRRSAVRPLSCGSPTGPPASPDPL